MTQYLPSFLPPSSPLHCAKGCILKKGWGNVLTENQFNYLIPIGFPERRGVIQVPKIYAPKFLTGGECRNGREASSQPSGQMTLMCHGDPWCFGSGTHQGNWQLPPGQSLQKSEYSNAGNSCSGLILAWSQKSWRVPLTAGGLGRVPIPHSAAIAWDTYLSLPSSELLFSTKGWILLHYKSIYFIIKGDEK